MTADNRPSWLSAEPCLPIFGPADAIAATPYLLGYHPPVGSMVVLGLDQLNPMPQPESRIRAVVRFDVPGAAELAHHVGEVADILTPLADETIVLGYGPADSIVPALKACHLALTSAQVLVKDLIRVQNGRYWALTAPYPAEGTSFDSSSNRAAAAAVLLGLVARPNREAFQHTLEPSRGADRDQVTAATRAARAQITTRLQMAAAFDWFSEGMTLVRRLLEHVQTSTAPLSAADVAQVSIRLTATTVHWGAIGLLHDYPDQVHVRLWTELTRRVELAYAAAPASLLAYVALRRGDGPLARAAVNRALRADPEHSFARVIDEAVSCGLPPSALHGGALDPGMITRINSEQAHRHPQATWPVFPAGPCEATR
jgi:hypothetical protein